MTRYVERASPADDGGLRPDRDERMAVHWVLLGLVCVPPVTWAWQTSMARKLCGYARFEQLRGMNIAAGVPPTPPDGGHAA